MAEADDYINQLIDKKLNKYVAQVDHKEKEMIKEYSIKFKQLETLINDKADDLRVHLEE